MTNDQQQDLIAKNLIIGYSAWAGYLSSDRGALICSINNPAVSMTGETFNSHYVAGYHLSAFLKAWLGVADTTTILHRISKKWSQFSLLIQGYASTVSKVLLADLTT
ncbi:MAG: hypothetical protein GVY04_22210 [Cyanobacteria bacterium]|jgi:hypothetical protein|nr:hypothetical protein [Cyanobacteria bacterium GSL.Bin1]